MLPQSLYKPALYEATGIVFRFVFLTHSCLNPDIRIIVCLFFPVKTVKIQHISEAKINSEVRFYSGLFFTQKIHPLNNQITFSNFMSPHIKKIVSFQSNKIKQINGFAL